MRDLDELEVTDSGPPVGLAEIIEVARTIGVQFPQDYVMFLLHANGGTPELDTFESQEGGVWTATTFYRVTRNRSDQEGLLLALNRLAHVLPHGIVPIAYDGGDNHTCLDLRANAKVQVVVWDHEVNRFYPVAHSFEAFLDRLYRNPFNTGDDWNQ